MVVYLISQQTMHKIQMSNLPLKAQTHVKAFLQHTSEYFLHAVTCRLWLQSVIIVQLYYLWFCMDLPSSYTSDHHYQYPPEDREPRCPVGARFRRLFYESNGDNNPESFERWLLSFVLASTL